MSQLVVDTVRDYLSTLLPGMGLELFDLQFRKEGHGWVLRVVIDNEEGVSLDHCSDVSRELGDYLDVEDLISHNYHLEVSSPGLERPLRSVADFQRFLAKTAKVKLHEAIEGQKVYVGTIEKIAENKICLKISEGKFVEFSFDEINKARLVF